MHSKKGNINKSKNFIQGLRPFSSSLPHGLKKILKKGGYNFSNIVDNWTKMVGKDISNYCYPNTIRMTKDMNNGTLILNVVHGNEINVEYKKQEIIDKINSFFGFNCIKEIKLKIVQKKQITQKIKNFSDQNYSKYNEKLKNIQNQDLKKSLSKLIKAYSK
jgi:hypothetical protein|tara:strand:+ start:550 stop:1032 length:483 start_codon:yes stop_codon:yes gene_type:complete